MHKSLNSSAEGKPRSTMSDRAFFKRLTKMGLARKVPRG